jgi:hypothetical protein
MIVTHGLGRHDDAPISILAFGLGSYELDGGFLNPAIERTFFFGAESRVLSIKESRAFFIDAESRSLVIEPDHRVLTINAEIRLCKIEQETRIFKFKGAR